MVARAQGGEALYCRLLHLAYPAAHAHTRKRAHKHTHTHHVCTDASTHAHSRSTTARMRGEWAAKEHIAGGRVKPALALEQRLDRRCARLCAGRVVLRFHGTRC